MRTLFTLLMATLGGLSGLLIFLDAVGIYSIARPLSLWLLFVVCSGLALSSFYPASQTDSRTDGRD
jgi:hypothetical protein